MPSYGRQIVGSTGQPLQVSADGDPEWRLGGITLDWAGSVTAVGADTTLPDGNVIKNGQKGLRYGQVLVMIGVAEVQTITVTATGGTLTFTGTDPRTGLTRTSAPLAFNASAATVQAEADLTFGPARALVTLAGGVYTYTFDRALGNVPTMTVDATALTGGTATVATSTQGGASGGLWGPYDSAAVDGRATIARGFTVILNETVLELGSLPQLGAGATAHPGGIEGGRLWRSRILATTGAASLAAGPTFANLEAALPRMTYAV